MKVYIGIDNGVSGGLAAISAISGTIISMTPMPTLVARQGNEVDILAVWKWVQPIEASREKITIIIEEPGGSKSAKAATSMAGSFHALRAMCALARIRWHRVTPQIWQKVMLPGCKAGDTKPRALTVARSLWPDEAFLATDRSKVPHEGLIDAALIGEYGRQKQL